MCGQQVGPTGSHTSKSRGKPRVGGERHPHEQEVGIVGYVCMPLVTAHAHLVCLMVAGLEKRGQGPQTLLTPRRLEVLLEICLIHLASTCV